MYKRYDEKSTPPLLGIKEMKVGGGVRPLAKMVVCTLSAVSCLTSSLESTSRANLQHALAVGTLVEVQGSLSIRRNKSAAGTTFTEVNLNAKSISTLATPKAKAPAAEEALL